MRLTKSNTCSEDLAARMIELDEDAFREFAEFFAPKFRAFFLARGLGILDAEDLTITCITDIALKVPRYRPTHGANFEKWVFTLARHSLADWWRDHQTPD